jgi:hopanoid biosynthesis associated protein HpnK
MKRLIINADDFGFTSGVNKGIVQSYKQGIVTSTTIMANGQAFDEAVELARDNPGLGVGCHLSIVGGHPVAAETQIKSLLEADGSLPATLTKLALKLTRRSVPLEQIVIEFRAQLERITRRGIKLTHVDTHKHSHTHPQVMKALAVAAGEFGIRCVRNPFEQIFANMSLTGYASWSFMKQSALSAAIRPGAIQFKKVIRKAGFETPNRFFGVKLTGMIDSMAIRSILEAPWEGTAELMCHPGLHDDELEQARTRLKRERERELEALCDPSLRLIAERHGVELIDYRGLC